MAGRRATAFNETVKRLKAELKLRNKAEVIGYIAYYGEVPGWMNSKAKRMIAKAERKEANLF
ncbi:hypothetical protein N8W35_10020 [Enterobacter roggenkampii]|uniref:hypothetical protein n=1 Tax=Enterobacter roggenkampii TaxID=1812935 RepID=UPI0021C733D7|nr:hypothetical protein [Enterobacter roggenkampii]MCU3853441.1 hypothetical protein [Enterobacter roggenkampii]